MSVLSMFSFTPDAIRHRPCKTCRSPMTFLRAKPARIGFDLHTFECANCNSVEKVTTETTAHRWINGNLAPPVR